MEIPLVQLVFPEGGATAGNRNVSAPVSSLAGGEGDRRKDADGGAPGGASKGRAVGSDDGWEEGEEDADSLDTDVLELGSPEEDGERGREDAGTRDGQRGSAAISGAPAASSQASSDGNDLTSDRIAPVVCTCGMKAATADTRFSMGALWARPSDAVYWQLGARAPDLAGSTAVGRGAGLESAQQGSDASARRIAVGDIISVQVKKPARCKAALRLIRGSVQTKMSMLAGKCVVLQTRDGAASGGVDLCFQSEQEAQTAAGLIGSVVGIE